MTTDTTDIKETPWVNPMQELENEMADYVKSQLYTYSAQNEMVAHANNLLQSFKIRKIDEQLQVPHYVWDNANEIIEAGKIGKFQEMLCRKQISAGGLRQDDKNLGGLQSKYSHS
eukprot:321711_1